MRDARVQKRHSVESNVCEMELKYVQHKNEYNCHATRRAINSVTFPHAFHWRCSRSWASTHCCNLQACRKFTRQFIRRRDKNVHEIVHAKLSELSRLN